MNVLVGPNNSGKSTVLGAFRVLASALRRARTKSSIAIGGANDGYRYGHPVSEDDIPISLENIHTNYATADTRVNFRVNNTMHLVLDFPKDGGCGLFVDPNSVHSRTPSWFKTHVPVTVGCVPVLGPVEHEEPLLQAETVQRSLSTHRASRHFRNYWYHFPDDFERFRSLIEETWPGMTIQPPERVDGEKGSTLIMFCKEHRIDRELFWVGFGFQVWCQLLTHILRYKEESLLVIDEPEIYLHPDLQKQLVRILRNAGPDVLIATHSSEILTESDPTDILLIDKRARAARHLKGVDDMQAALEYLGSSQNITLAQLSRTRRVVFVEGDDFRLLRRFAERLKLTDLASGFDITPVSVDGSGEWQKILAVAWGIEKTVGKPMLLSAIFDRDYFCAMEIDNRLGELRQRLKLAHVHARKQIENYFLIPAALDRAIAKARRDRLRRSGQEVPDVGTARDLLVPITDSVKNDAQAQYVAKWNEFVKRTNPKTDASTSTKDAITWFEGKWARLETRLEVVPGKEVFAALNRALGEKGGIGLNPSAVIAEMQAEDLPGDLVQLLQELENFRKATVQL